MRNAISLSPTNSGSTISIQFPLLKQFNKHLLQNPIKHKYKRANGSGKLIYFTQSANRNNSAEQNITSNSIASQRDMQNNNSSHVDEFEQKLTRSVQSSIMLQYYSQNSTKNKLLNEDRKEERGRQEIIDSDAKVEKNFRNYSLEEKEVLMPKNKLSLIQIAKFPTQRQVENPKISHQINEITNRKDDAIKSELLKKFRSHFYLKKEIKQFPKLSQSQSPRAKNFTEDNTYYRSDTPKFGLKFKQKSHSQKNLHSNTDFLLEGLKASLNPTELNISHKDKLEYKLQIPRIFGSVSNSTKSIESNYSLSEFQSNASKLFHKLQTQERMCSQGSAIHMNTSREYLTPLPIIPETVLVKRQKTPVVTFNVNHSRGKPPISPISPVRGPKGFRFLRNQSPVVAIQNTIQTQSMKGNIFFKSPNYASNTQLESAISNLETEDLLE